MHRRSFLKTSALLPAWIAAVARAQEPETEGPPPRTDALRAAWDEARRLGRPLLILVIPAPKRDRNGEASRRGLAWGQVLHFGADEILADLSLCVIACATLAEVRRSLPQSAGVAGIEGEPLAIAVESDLAGATRIDLELARIETPTPWRSNEEVTPEEAQERYEREVKERIGAIGVALRAVLAPSEAALVRRAAQARAANPDLAEPVLAAEPDDDLRALVALAPAVVRRAAERSPHRVETLAVLAAYARTNSLATSPAGSLWGENTGCGTHIEGLGGRSNLIACGMGHVPALGRKFLHFYTSS